MTCPKCGEDQVHVTETIRGYGSKVYRRRHCLWCDAKFKTIEDILPDDEESQRDYRLAIKNKSAMLQSFYK